jgi:fatty-acyl-CoA synthase
MLGLMQDWPLLVHKLIDYAAENHGSRPVVSRNADGAIERTDYATVRARALKLAKALDRRGIKNGDRIATLAWNGYRHLESWYGIAGIGAVYHTLNPRLFPDQIVWIANHARDKALFFDPCFADLVAEIAPRLKSVEFFVALTDRKGLPKIKLPKKLIAYEDFIAVKGDFAWKSFDEKTACGLCYTSGTTGNPKGVLYSHRSNVLHAFMANLADAQRLTSSDVILPVVPMFHANAWAIAFTAPMTGAKLVLPGPKLDGPSVHELLEKEGVTIAAAVPTVWLALLQYLDAENLKLTSLKRVLIGGAACPPMMIRRFEQDFGVEVEHAWGMTELSPIGTLGALKPQILARPYEARLAAKTKQGFPSFGVEMKITDARNKTLPRDGQSAGHLKVRGPAVAKAYFRGAGKEAFDKQGWFDTGDIATIDADGYMAITDRAKDVIKSGGEWISSIAIENIALSHPALAETAVVGMPHPKWGERPLLVAVLKPGAQTDKAQILAYLTGKIAKWWLPDDVVFLPEIPHTATGKILKMQLRVLLRDFSFGP